MTVSNYLSTEMQEKRPFKSIHDGICINCKNLLLLKFVNWHCLHECSKSVPKMVANFYDFTLLNRYLKETQKDFKNL